MNETTQKTIEERPEWWVFEKEKGRLIAVRIFVTMEKRYKSIIGC